MELTFSELRQKEVINICDGRRLGRICDIVFDYPKRIITGIVVPGCRRGGFFRSSPELFISMGCITKIGEDVILVDLIKARKTGTGGCCTGGGIGSGAGSYQSGSGGSLYASTAQYEASEKVRTLKENNDEFE